jgi:hypothetical protein
MNMAYNMNGTVKYTHIAVLSIQLGGNHLEALDMDRRILYI